MRGHARIRHVSEHVVVVAHLEFLREAGQAEVGDALANLGVPALDLPDTPAGAHQWPLAACSARPPTLDAHASPQPALLLRQEQAEFLVVAPCLRGAWHVSVRRQTCTTLGWPCTCASLTRQERLEVRPDVFGPFDHDGVKIGRRQRPDQL